ncbi:hypothetical protein SEA_JONJAMES_16 [Gordonia Phage JonJames]|nr:hypothetical protein SEA_JONJAMES_16 [Gordonia Phage JonJames]
MAEKLTPEQVDKALLEWYQGNVDEHVAKNPDRAPRRVYVEGAWYSISYHKGPVDVPGLGIVTHEETFDEEGHTNHYVVIHVDRGNSYEEPLYFKRCGWRQSHYGSELDGPTVQVRPNVRTITEWNEV